MSCEPWVYSCLRKSCIQYAFVIRGLFTAAILFFFATGLRGETYEQWETSIPNQQQVPFTNWLPPSVNSSQVNNQDYSVFDSPLGHLFGYLDFSSVPPSSFPLKVRFLYYDIGPSAMSPTPNGYKDRLPEWTSPIGYIARGARIGDLIEHREIQVKSIAEGNAVPVWSIWAPSNRVNSYGPFNPYSVLLEVTSQDGTLLVRKCLIEAVASATTRNVCLARNNSGAEAYVKSLADITAVDALPTQEKVYEDVRVLWLDDSSLQDAKYTNNFWQKVFLAHTMILGHANEVQELAQRLGIFPNQCVLQGGLWSVDNPVINFSEQLKGPNGQYNLELTKGDNPFERPSDFVKKRTTELRRFSICFLVSFTIFEIAIIIGSLFLLHGHRRVFRWLLIPLSAIVYTALGFIVVHFVVDFRPEVQIFQEVDSVEGWPQRLVRTDIMRLGFEDGPATFSAPALADFSWFGIEPYFCPIQCSQMDDKTVFSIRQRYGRFTSTHIRYWLPSDSPCQITASREIVATRPLNGAWIWDGKVWRSLGPMESGKPIAINAARVVIDPSTISGNEEGAPGDLQQPYRNQDLLPEVVRRMCTKKYMKSLGNTDVGILLAIDPQAAPDQMGDAAVSEIHTQTLLVHQFQLPAIKP
jgi:hypothetical protein